MVSGSDQEKGKPYVTDATNVEIRHTSRTGGNWLKWWIDRKM
jgi:hypothetical protein